MSDAKPQHVEPKKSAACIIMSDETPARVLMVRRGVKMRFMAGHHAFPGGRVDEGEGTSHVVGAENDEEAAAIHAVVREVFEETGLLLTKGAEPDPEVVRAARRELLENEGRFDAILERLGQSIDAARFEPAGVWITPKGSPIRFHSRYYLYRGAKPGGEELISGEVDALDWLTPAEARARWRRNELILPAPVAYVLQQLAVIPYPAVLEPLRRTTHVTPDTPGRIEYRPGIYVLPQKTPTLPPATGTNCVVVGDSDLYIIDPATPFPDDQAAFGRHLDQMLELGGRIAAAIITHSHIDHIGAAEFVRRRYGVPIWGHRLNEGRVPFTLDRHIEHNEVIEIPGDPPWRLRALFTPGHDVSHLCFVEETTGTLMAGDMVAEKGSVVVAEEYGGDMDDYMASLDLLLATDHNMMIPAHGLAITDPKAKVREYIAHRLEREDRIRKAHEAGARTIDELLAGSYSDVAPHLRPLAEKSLRAHLKRLSITPQAS